MRAVALALAAVLLAACGGDGARVTVLAASSVAALVEDVTSDLDVDVSEGGTPQLVAQVRANGTAGLDLLLLADEDAASALATDVAGVPAPLPWAATGLVVVTSPGRDDLVGRNLAQLATDASLTWVLADEGVPLGDATRRALAPWLDGILTRTLSLEPSALAVLAKVGSGPDLAVAYAANAAERGAGLVVLQPLPDEVVVIHLQPLTAAGRELADRLLADVDALARHGFELASR